MKINWVLEKEIFKDHHDRLSHAATDAGHPVFTWDDLWWENGKWPIGKDGLTVFHGSLGNAHRIVSDLPWRPGAFCNTSAFACRVWYETAKPYLLHDKYAFSTVEELVTQPEGCLAKIGSPETFFVRPDSPLKPFSGRVLHYADLSLEALDYGFYYDDKRIPIVITPTVDVGREWRFVIAEREVVTHSEYEAAQRQETNSTCPPEVVDFAARAALSMNPPDPIYILDVCETGGNLKLIEINPFSGADLYSCDRRAVVSAVETILAAAK